MKSIKSKLFLVSFFMISVMFAADVDIISSVTVMHASGEARIVAQVHHAETQNELAVLKSELHATRTELEKLSQYLVNVLQPAKLVADVHAEIVDRKTSPEVLSAIGIEAAQILEEVLTESDRDRRSARVKNVFFQSQSSHVIVFHHLKKQEIAAHAAGRILRGTVFQSNEAGSGVVSRLRELRY